MKLLKAWKAAVMIAVIIGIVITAAACSGGNSSQVLGVTADVVKGSEGIKNTADICVESNRYQQGESVVFRVKVIDPATGDAMDDQALQTVVISLSDGQTFNARYGGHPGGQDATPTDFFWTTAWEIPGNYPTGSVPYTVKATATDGRTGTFSQFNVAPSLLMVVAP